MNASSVLLTGFLGAGPSAPRVLSREPLLVLRGPRSPLRGRTPAVATRAEGEQGAATRARPRRGERGCAAGLGLPASLARGRATLPPPPHFLFGFDTASRLRKSDGELAGLSLAS